MKPRSERGRLALTMPRLSRYGGAESFAWRLAEALAARGHGVDFICARCETEPPTGVRPVTVGRFGGLRLIKTLWFALMADRAVKRGGYDLVVGLGNTVNQDILRIGGGPISVFQQLSKRAWPAGFARDFKMLRRRLAPVNWVIRWLDDARMRRTRRIVCVSHLVRDWVVRAHPFLRAQDIDVVYNRPDLGRFARVTDAEREALRREAGIGPDRFVIGTAATNFALKGVRYLIEALAGLPENFELHVAGGRHADKYLRQARALGVEDRVRFLGKVDDMRSFYGRTDLFVLATFYDACSNAVLEALACGCRVVSSALNGSAHFLPGKWVFPDPSDVDGLTSILGRVAAEERPGPFAWPDDVPSGLDPYVEMIESALAQK
ncbi:glycosyltransferase family 4 protein [Pseudodesulfovibrio sp.]|uniref:glycosyltransferase family 4 protein n=1 Tax=Pseudodesulfovibrio sp. TaxID=2035812 RepID=UPI00260F9F79|nr:glycosyltransferase family 4 protein [Pseudodesulfovibrio sp.]MDD3313623.1 glycosyltransferase family 4 protein [Pseudodesulfovibrio sp.]